MIVLPFSGSSAVLLVSPSACLPVFSAPLAEVFLVKVQQKSWTDGIIA
jgi:hypothetical protein